MFYIYTKVTNLSKTVKVMYSNKGILLYLGITAVNLDDIVCPQCFTTTSKFMPFWIGLQVDTVTLEWYCNTRIPEWSFQFMLARSTVIRTTCFTLLASLFKFELSGFFFLQKCISLNNILKSYTRHIHVFLWCNQFLLERQLFSSTDSLWYVYLFG